MRTRIRNLKTKAAAVWFSMLAAPVFADDISTKLETVTQKVIGVLNSNWVKLVLVALLCGAAIAFAFNKDNDKIKRNCIALGIAAVILLSADLIISVVWDT